MTNLTENERICPVCGTVFSLIYIDKHGYSYTTDTEHCSKSCAGKARTHIDPDQLRSKALDFISEQGRYCTGAEIFSGTGHSSKTFIKNGIKVSELNSEFDFSKPRSVFQERVKEILSERYPDLESEKTFDGLLGSTGYPLRVDFYIPSENMVVEADGLHHNFENHPWAKWKNGTIREYDLIKEKFLDDNGIRLCRIPYKHNVKSEDVIVHLD